MKNKPVTSLRPQRSLNFTDLINSDWTPTYAETNRNRRQRHSPQLTSSSLSQRRLDEGASQLPHAAEENREGA